MLRTRIDRIAHEAGAETVAVSLYDYASETAWSLRGARPFHAASTIKVAVLFALFEAFDRGELPAGGVLHVRNRFLSAADQEPYTVAADRDANAAVFARRGKVMPLVELAEHMIQTSSNLATNLLVDLLGAARIQETLHDHDVPGVSIVRGVEDERAWEAGLNNEVTADGLVRLFRVIHDGTLSRESTDTMHAILSGQQFRSGIPGGLPADVRSDAEIAHKTGEISTVAHDAGIVTLSERQPYVLAILTQWKPGADSSRREALAAISGAIYESIAGSDD